MLRQLIDKIRPAAMTAAMLLAAGCQDDKTATGGPMTFQNGDNTFECPAAGGSKEISFYSRCGAWKIVPDGESAPWVDVWPAYGDDNGRTKLTVAAAADGYDREVTLNVVSTQGTLGRIVVKQAGQTPQIKLNITTSRVKIDVAGTPVVIEVNSNVKWEAVVTEGGSWISLGKTTETSQEFLFPDNTDQPKRTGAVSFNMVGGDYKIPVVVEQMDGNTSFERAEMVPISRLLGEVHLIDGEFELESNYAVEGWITSDFANKNLPDTVLYVQDASGRGLRFALKDKKEFLEPAAGQTGWFAQDRKVAIHLVGATFGEDSYGNLCIKDFAAASVKSSAGEAPQNPLPVVLPDMTTLSQYGNTLVRVDPVEFVTPYGGYAPFFESSTQSESTVEELWKKEVPAAYKAQFPDPTLAPHLLRDKQGNVLKVFFQRSFTQVWAKNLPAGSGPLTAVISKFRGETILQIRNKEDDNLSSDASTRFSKPLMQAGPWLTLNDKVASFTAGNSGGDHSSVIFSVYDSKNDFGVYPGSSGAIASYWLPTYVRRRHDTACTTSAAATTNGYYALNARQWWGVTALNSLVSNTEDMGEALIIRTNTLRNATGDLYLTLSNGGSKGGPGSMKIQWSDSAESDLTKVQFQTIATFEAPCIDYTPFLFPYSFRLPDAMKGKAQVTILVRCADEFSAKRDNSKITATGTTRMGDLGIVEIK